MTDERRHDGHGGDSTAPYRLTADEVLDRVAGDRSGSTQTRCGGDSTSTVPTASASRRR